MRKRNLGLLATLAIGAAAMTACGNEKPAVDNSTEVISTEDATTDVDNQPAAPGEGPMGDEMQGVGEEEGADENVGDIEGVVSIPSNDTIDKIFTEVRAQLGENYFPNMPIDAMFLRDIYGLDLANIEAVFGEMPMISANVDTFIAIKAVEGKAEDIKTSLETYLTAQKEDAFQYPKNVPVIQSAEVYVSGDYVFYICLAGDTMAAAEKGDEEIAKQAKQMVSDAKQVIDKNLK